MNILAFLNAYTTGKSGGDIAFIETFKRIKDTKLTVVTSQLGKQLCENHGLEATYIITTHEKEFGNILRIYIKRIVAAIFITRTQKPDIVYATSDALPDVFPSFVMKLRFGQNIKWIQKSFHLIPSARVISHMSQQLSFFFIKKYADIIILDNESLMNDFVTLGFKQEKLRVNHLGVDLKTIQVIKPSLENYDGIFLGRLHESKGVFDLITIWKQVVNTHSQAKLCIVGQGSPEITNKLKEEIKNNNLQKNIILKGYLSDKESFSLIKSSKLFVFPSHEEGFGLVIGEALACGTPIVAYDLPAYKNTFKSAITTVQLGDINTFSQQIIKLISSEKKRTEMIQKGTTLINTFTWEKTAEREQQLL